jgi:hypothetical protein
MKSHRTLIIKISSIVVGCLLILGYGLFQARNLIVGPQISVLTPSNGENLVDPLMTIAGVAINITRITLNDRPIFVDKQGNFSEKLLASPGYNIIKLAAQDKFGRTTQRLIELNYTERVNYAPASTSSATSTNIIQ